MDDTRQNAKELGDFAQPLPKRKKSELRFTIPAGSRAALLEEMRKVGRNSRTLHVKEVIRRGCPTFAARELVRLLEDPQVPPEELQRRLAESPQTDTIQVKRVSLPKTPGTGASG